jgi:membrane protein implicated in regulation of membrane protease activity
VFVSNHPQFNLLQNRLARLPRWGQIAVRVAILLPLVALVLGIILLALGSGLFVLAAVLLIVAIARILRRLLHRPIDDGRRNVKIVVQSARVIDP